MINHSFLTFNLFWIKKRACKVKIILKRFTNYKSYYVDRQNQLIGLGVAYSSYADRTTGSSYLLLHFDGYELIELVNVPLGGLPANLRGVYIDGYMYMFGKNDFKVEKVFE